MQLTPPSLEVAIIAAIAALVVALLSAFVSLWTARKTRSASLDQKLLESELRTKEARQLRLESLAASAQRLRTNIQSLSHSLRNRIAGSHTAEASLKNLSDLSIALNEFEEQWGETRADFLIAFGLQSEQRMRFLRHEVRNETRTVLQSSERLGKMLKRSYSPQAAAATRPQECNAAVVQLNESVDSTLRALDNYYYSLAAYLSIESPAVGKRALLNLEDARPSPYSIEPIPLPFPERRGDA